VRDERFGQARVIFDQDVPIGEDTQHDLLQHLVFAHDHLL